MATQKQQSPRLGFPGGFSGLYLRLGTMTLSWHPCPGMTNTMEARLGTRRVGQIGLEVNGKSWYAHAGLAVDPKPGSWTTDRKNFPTADEAREYIESRVRLMLREYSGAHPVAPKPTDELLEYSVERPSRGPKQPVDFAIRFITPKEKWRLPDR